MIGFALRRIILTKYSKRSNSSKRMTRVWKITLTKKWQLQDLIFKITRISCKRHAMISIKELTQIKQILRATRRKLGRLTLKSSKWKLMKKISSTNWTNSLTKLTTKKQIWSIWLMKPKKTWRNVSETSTNTTQRVLRKWGKRLNR